MDSSGSGQGQDRILVNRIMNLQIP